MSALLDLADFSVNYGKRVVVDGVSLSIAEGESVGIVGASGGGKTTLARAVAGIVPVGAGSLRWRGQAIEALSLAARRRAGANIGVVFQDPQSSLNPRIPIWQTITEGAWITGMGTAARRREAARLMELVALDTTLAEQRPHALSGGQRQRVAVARALCTAPPLLVLDEPTSALDVSVQAKVLDLLAGLRRELGLSYLLVTHDLHVVSRMCDRVLVMEAGRIVEELPAGDLLRSAQHPYTRLLAAATPSMHRRMDLTQFAAADAERRASA